MQWSRKVARSSRIHFFELYLTLTKFLSNFNEPRRNAAHRRCVFAERKFLTIQKVCWAKGLSRKPKVLPFLDTSLASQPLKYSRNLPLTASKSNGLPKCAFMPTAKHLSISSLNTFAVMATIGTFLALSLSKARIFVVA